MMAEHVPRSRDRIVAARRCVAVFEHKGLGDFTFTSCHAINAELRNMGVVQCLSLLAWDSSRPVVVLARRCICLPVLPTPRRRHATLDGMSAKHTVVALEAVTQEIIDLVVAEAGTVDVTAGSTLQSWGIDSLKVMSLVFKIEERYGIVLDEEGADDLRTVGDLAALVLRCIQEQP
jgi:acyl carrier protein